MITFQKDIPNIGKIKIKFVFDENAEENFHKYLKKYSYSTIFKDGEFNTLGISNYCSFRNRCSPNIYNNSFMYNLRQCVMSLYNFVWYNNLTNNT